MVLTILNAIIKVFAAVPTLNTWFQELVKLYVQIQGAAMSKENRDAVRKALDEHDQRDMEKAVNSPTAGKISGDPGTVVVDAPPPNVRMPHP